MKDIKVPAIGESITEATIEKWLKQEGELVKKDEAIVSIESDKATVEVPAPATGVLKATARKAGDRVKIGEVIGQLDDTATVGAAPAAEKPAEKANGAAGAQTGGKQAPAGPAARRAAAEAGVELSQVQGTGPGGRVLKEDVARHTNPDAVPVARSGTAQMPEIAPPAHTGATALPQQQFKGPEHVPSAGPREEQVVPMTPIRRTIARRLVEAKQTTAMLTTFNEVDMSRVMALRAQYQDGFTKKYGIKLGFMSFFVKAAIEALKTYPAVNAEIRGENVVYKNYYDIGVAIGGGKGLTVPVLRDAETQSFAELELAIADFGKRAQANKIKIEELQGGTFTITNGGIYGSMMSTPILNPPQSGILGMHNIVKRAVVVDDQVVVRPMMYLALSYDHRIVDGREAVQFLVKVKECIEAPERILLEI